MRYFIYVDNELQEVPEYHYEVWCSIEKEKYVLPDYSILIDGNQYSIETMYQGAVDIDEEPLPFVLLYFEDVWEIKTEGLTKTESNDTIEYFATFEELVIRRNQLIYRIEGMISINKLTN